MDPIETKQEAIESLDRLNRLNARRKPLKDFINTNPNYWMMGKVQRSELDTEASKMKLARIPADRSGSGAQAQETNMGAGKDT